LLIILKYKILSYFLSKISAKVSASFEVGISMPFGYNLSGSWVQLMFLAIFTAFQSDFEFPGNIPFLTFLVLADLLKDLISLSIETILFKSSQSKIVD